MCVCILFLVSLLCYHLFASSYAYQSIRAHQPAEQGEGMQLPHRPYKCTVMQRNVLSVKCCTYIYHGHRIILAQNTMHAQGSIQLEFSNTCPLDLNFPTSWVDEPALGTPMTKFNRSIKVQQTFHCSHGQYYCSLAHFWAVLSCQPSTHI